MFSYLRTLPYLIRNYSSKSNIKNVFATRTTNLNKIVAVKGWIKAVRGMKESVFLDINDGSCGENLQLVCNKSDKDKLGFGASIEAIGVLSETPKGQLEIKVDKFKIIGDCPLNEGYPYVAKQSYPPEYVRQNLHFRSRVSSFAATLRCRHNLTNSINNYLNNNDFLQIHTPILTSNDCEGAGEVFKVNPDSENLLKTMRKSDKDKSEEIFFNQKVFLTVSGQLHLEAMSHGLSKVYTFGPTFRAENSKSAVHLSEFYMLELEESFIESISDVVKRISSLFRHVSKDFLEKSSDDIVKINKSKDFNINDHFNFLDKDFPTVSYNEAFKIVEQNRDKFKKPPKFEDGLSKEQEIFLAKYFEGPLFVVDWPKIQKSFYMREKRDNPDIVEALDFIIPNIGEVAGGSVREDNYNTLKSKMPTDESLRWYLELRKYGSVRTGGFGMGFERYLQFLLNIHSIKDVIPFPRWPHNCSM